MKWTGWTVWTHRRNPLSSDCQHYISSVGRASYFRTNPIHPPIGRGWPPSSPDGGMDGAAAPAVGRFVRLNLVGHPSFRNGRIGYVQAVAWRVRSQASGHKSASSDIGSTGPSPGRRCTHYDPLGLQGQAGFDGRPVERRNDRIPSFKDLLLSRVVATDAFPNALSSTAGSRRPRSHRRPGTERASIPSSP